MSRWVTTTAIVCGLVVAHLALCIGQMGESLWLDELHTTWTLRDGPASIATRAAMGNQTPAYFYAVWFATQIGGWHEWSVRLPSMVCGTLFPVAIFACGWHLFGSRAAALAMAMLALVDGHLAFYSLEARPYAAVHLVVLLHVVLFAKWLAASPAAKEEKAPAWLALGWSLSGCIMLHVHLTAGWFLLAEWGILVAAVAWGTVRTSRVGVPWAISVCLSLTVLPWVWGVLLRSGAWRQFVPIPNIVDLATIAPWLSLIVLPGVLRCADSWLPQRAVPTQGRNHDSDPSQTTGPRNTRPFPPRLAEPWLLLCLVTGSVLAAAWCVSYLDILRLFYRRYLYSMFGIGALIGCGLLSKIAPPRRPWIALAFSLYAVMVSPTVTRAWKQMPIVQRAQEDWRSVAAWMDREAPARVWIDAGLIECQCLDEQGIPGAPGWAERAPLLAKSYCCLPLTGFYPVPAQTEVMPITVAQPPAAPGDSVWVVCRRPPNWSLWEKAGWRATRHTAFGRVTLWWLEPAT